MPVNAPYNTPTVPLRICLHTAEGKRTLDVDPAWSVFAPCRDFPSTIAGAMPAVWAASGPRRSSGYGGAKSALTILDEQHHAASRIMRGKVCPNLLCNLALRAIAASPLSILAAVTEHGEPAPETMTTIQANVFHAIMSPADGYPGGLVPFVMPMTNEEMIEAIGSSSIAAALSGTPQDNPRVEMHYRFQRAADIFRLMSATSKPYPDVVCGAGIAEIENGPYKVMGIKPFISMRSGEAFAQPQTRRPEKIHEYANGKAPVSLVSIPTATPSLSLPTILYNLSCSLPDVPMTARQIADHVLEISHLTTSLLFGHAEQSVRDSMMAAIRQPLLDTLIPPDGKASDWTVFEVNKPSFTLRKILDAEDADSNRPLSQAIQNWNQDRLEFCASPDPMMLVSGGDETDFPTLAHRLTQEAQFHLTAIDDLWSQIAPPSLGNKRPSVTTEIRSGLTALEAARSHDADPAHTPNASKLTGGPSPAR